MPRKTIDQQYGNPSGRFVRHLHTDNHARKSFKDFMGPSARARYWPMRILTGEWAVIRNPLMEPLLHRGRKNHG